VALIFVVTVAMLSVAISDAHLPLAPSGVLKVLLLAGFGVRVLIEPTRWPGVLLLVAVAGIAGTVAGLETGASSINAILVPPLIVVVALLGVTVAAITLRVLRSRERAGEAVRVLGGVALAVSLLAYPYALVEHQATVKLSHRAGRLIDERRGAFRGVKLGDPAIVAQRVFGSASAPRPDPNTAPLQGSDGFDGPSSFNFKPPQDTSLRYPHVGFALESGRVRWIDVNDSAVATATGIGPGDSMSLVHLAYPGARCGEDSLGGDSGDIPYPVCAIRFGAGRWLTFFGTYRKAETPILAIWLSTRRVE